jgi:hypothetical protein
MHSDSFHWSVLIPIVAIVGGMGMGVIGMITEHRRKQALLEERRLMIEKGMTPPPLSEQVLDAGAPTAGTQSSIESSLKTGVITLFVGLGLMAAFLVLRYVVAEDFAVIPRPFLALLGPAGALVSLIGIGNLFYFWVASRRAAGGR